MMFLRQWAMLKQMPQPNKRLGTIGHCLKNIISRVNIGILKKAKQLLIKYKYAKCAKNTTIPEGPGENIVIDFTDMGELKVDGFCWQRSTSIPNDQKRTGKEDSKAVIKCYQN